MPRSCATPSTLESALYVTIFSTICVAATKYHWYKLLSGGARRAKKIQHQALSSNSKVKVVVVTGCDRGIGRLLCTQLLQENQDNKAEGSSTRSNLVIVALCLTPTAVVELKAAGIKHALVCDVTNEEHIQKMKRHVQDLLDNNPQAILHTLVNNAAIANPGDFLWFADLTQFRNVMRVNFEGQLAVTHALLPLMLRHSTQHGDARILNMSSVCGTTASPSNSAYSASKFAVEAWSDSLRLELAPLGITVVKIRPGQVSTQVQADYGRNLLKNYKAAPALIQELYGGDAYSKDVEGIMKGMTEGMDNLTHPNRVVDALLDMMEMQPRKLKPYYWIGADAHTFWRALHNLPTAVVDTVKQGLLHFGPKTPHSPPLNVVSHVTIRVRSLEKALPFYQAFGLEVYGPTQNGQQFLRSGASQSHWPTLVLLQEDANMVDRAESFRAGMTRLCIYTTSLHSDVKRLEKEHGLKPYAPTAFQSMTRGIMSVYITAYQDPNGFVVYLIQFQGLIGMFLRANLWWNKKQAPVLFHWTVNVADVYRAMAVFDKLGFQTLSDQDKDQVGNDLLPAFRMDPETTVIEHIRLCKLPQDSFVATLMQWVEPRSDKAGGAELLNSMTISVDCVESALDMAQQAGMTVVEGDAVEQRQLPVFGSVRVGTAYVEEGNCRVEFCCFTDKR